MVSRCLADQGICSGLQHSQCCAKELVMRSGRPPQRGLWGIKCCCRTPFYNFRGWECVFVFNFRLVLVWSCRLSAPLLLEGFLEQSLNLISPRNPISVLGGSVVPQTKAQGRNEQDSIQSTLMSWTQRDTSMGTPWWLPKDQKWRWRFWYKWNTMNFQKPTVK